MPIYVDGFVLPIPKKKKAAYLKMARMGAKLWMEHGALSYVEAIADDVPHGKWTSFPRAVKLKPNEIAWFSFITYKSRRDRDRINKKVMSDPRLAGWNMKNMPFDMKRMIFGGFKSMVHR